MFVSKVSRSFRRRPLWWVAWVSCAAGALWALVTARRGADSARLALDFPAARPAHLAHILADVSAHDFLQPGSWSLEEDSGNYTWWRYSISYSCGPRCSGRAWVQAWAVGDAGAEGVKGGAEPEGGPHHGQARTHRVEMRRRHCERLPLIPWDLFCEEIETESVVSPLEGGRGGARVRQVWARRCGALAALAGRCAGTRLADTLPHALPPHTRTL